MCADTEQVTGKPARARDRGEAALDAHGVHEDTAAPARSARSSAGDLVRTLAWAVAYVVGAWVGQKTVSGNSDFAMAWPASGIGLAWVATSTTRLRPVAVTLVGVLAAGTAYATDGSVWATLDGLLGVPLGLVVFLVLSRHWAPGLWGTGGSAEIGALRQYGALLGATILAGVTEGLVALVVLLPEPGTPFERAGELALTHTVAMATVGVTLLVLGAWLLALPATTVRDRLAAVRRTIRRRELVLAAGGLVVTVAATLTGYLWLTDAPIGFVLVMMVAVAAIRFGPPLTAFYALGVTAAACWFTAAEHGPVAEIADPHRRALAFAIFTTAVVCTGLTIAFSRRERDATIALLRESERAAEVLAEDLSLVLANLEEGVAVVEQGGRFVHANPAMDRLLGPVDLGAVGQPGADAPLDAYRLTDSAGHVLVGSDLPHTRAFSGEEEVHEVVNLGRPGGPVERVFEVTGRMLPRTHDNDRPRAVTTVRDITAERQERDALASFAQVVAHDLRSPLTSVELWAVELLESLDNGPVDAATATMMLGHIRSAAGRMQTFIGDLLMYALSRDQAPSPTRVELTDVVEAVVETITAVDGVEPDVRYDDLPAVWADPVLLPQVFDNLIGNARKYVADGVVPQVRIEAEPLSEGWARVRVIDNGVGIAPEDRARVFETFERARATEYDGTGLGLAICRHIVERHGGTIGVTTPPDWSGTCIELTLPLTSDAFESSTARVGG
jgi:signal transduction histidine kinase